MKKLLTVATILLSLTICEIASAALIDRSSNIFSIVKATSTIQPLDTKARQGSTRVGGKNSKGKGGKYVGGRRK